jgi:hypothetical protein
MVMSQTSLIFEFRVVLCAPSCASPPKMYFQTKPIGASNSFPSSFRQTLSDLRFAMSLPEAGHWSG